jgi:hypothetical protein
MHGSFPFGSQAAKRALQITPGTAIPAPPLTVNVGIALAGRLAPGRVAFFGKIGALGEPLAAFLTLSAC